MRFRGKGQVFIAKDNAPCGTASYDLEIRPRQSTKGRDMEGDFAVSGGLIGRSLARITGLDLVKVRQLVPRFPLYEVHLKLVLEDGWSVLFTVQPDEGVKFTGGVMLPDGGTS